MNSTRVAHGLPIAMSVAVCLVVLMLVWRRRRGSPAARHYAWVMLGQVTWGFGYLCELLARSLSG
jgi:hypothetical protein